MVLPWVVLKTLKSQVQLRQAGEEEGIPAIGADPGQTTESLLICSPVITTECFLVTQQIRTSYHSWHLHMFS